MLGGDDIESTEKDKESEQEINLLPIENSDSTEMNIPNESNQNNENGPSKELEKTTTSIPYQVLNTESTTTSKPQTTSTKNLNVFRKFNRYRIIKQF